VVVRRVEWTKDDAQKALAARQLGLTEEKEKAAAPIPHGLGDGPTRGWTGRLPLRRPSPPFASWLIQRGRSLREVQEALSHATQAMTLRYSHRQHIESLERVEVAEVSEVLDVLPAR
jgi:integrase